MITNILHVHTLNGVCNPGRANLLISEMLGTEGFKFFMIFHTKTRFASMLSSLGVVCTHTVCITCICQFLCGLQVSLDCSETNIFLFLTTGPILFPARLKQYDVTESVLQKAFLQYLGGRSNLCWTLTKPATIGFYRDLHQYLRKWLPAHSASKTAVGMFYLLIDVPGGCPVDPITFIPLYKELLVI